MTDLILPKHSLLDDGQTLFRSQEVTQEFLDECHQNRMASNHVPMGDYHQVASIPTAVVDQWAREGFDIYQESLPAILRRLRQQDLQAFITTDKHI